jgi:hypothetical protein
MDVRTAIADGHTRQCHAGKRNVGRGYHYGAHLRTRAGRGLECDKAGSADFREIHRAVVARV